MTHQRSTTAAPGRAPTVGALIALLALLPATSAWAQTQCTGFAEGQVIGGGTNGVQSVQLADLNGDGNLDVLTGSFGDGKIFWYRNDGAMAPALPTFEPRLITDSLGSVSSVFPANLDGDGDIDVLATSRTDNNVVWYENHGGLAPLFSVHQIAGSLGTPESVYAEDIDGDGDTDVLTAAFVSDTIAWYENLGGTPLEFEQHVISTEADGAASVFAVDLDGDQDVDVVSASRLDNRVVWYESDGATPPTFTRHVITASAMGATWVYVDDVDGDGSPDVLSASSGDNTIAWYESDGAKPPTFTRHNISTQALAASTVYTEDVDGDGNVDVLSSSRNDNKIAWYKNDAATPLGFTEQVISTDAIGAAAVIAGKLDADNDLDVVSVSSVAGFPASQDKVAWYVNDGAAPPTLPTLTEQVISGSADGAVSVFAGEDLDGDGIIDVASAGRTNKIAWYKNSGGPQPTFTESIVSTNAAGATSVFAADLDGDNDFDLISTSEDDDKIVWYENDSVQTPPTPPTFATVHPVTDLADGVQDVYAADLDGRNGIDLVSASENDNTISWWENTDGSGNFKEHVVTTEALGARSVFAADLDGDMDIDLLSASSGDNTVSWYESVPTSPTDPTLKFLKHDLSTTETRVSSVHAADFNGDGHIDVLAAVAGRNEVTWWENNGVTPDPAFTKRVIVVSADIATDAIAADLDGDMDQDVISTLVGDRATVWLENSGDDPPSWTVHFLSVNADYPSGAAAADLNGDSAPDIVVAERLSIPWFASTDEICQRFDANGDDVIDGIELSWIGRAFGLDVTDPVNDWWSGVDFNEDGIVDGEDLAILGAPGVFGSSTTDCTFTCR